MYKVLVVDDEYQALKGLEIMIDWESMGFEICGLCTNGQEAIQEIQRSLPDIVITDIRMPVINGLELIEYVKKNVDYDIKFVIMSAYSEFEYAKKAMEQGVNHYIVKPIIEEEVDQVLKEIYEQFEKQSKFKYIQKEFERETIVNIILKLIQGNYIDESMKQKFCRNFQNKEWYYILIEIESKANTNSMTDVIESIEQYIGSREDVFFFSVNVSSNGVVLGIEKSTNAKSEIYNFAYGIYHTIKSLYNTDINMSISHGVSSILQIKDAYTAALEAMKFKVFMNSSGPIIYEHVKDRSINFEFEKVQLVEKLFEALANADEKKANEVIRTVKEEFYHKQISPDILKMLIINVVYKSIHLIEETDRDYSKLLSMCDIKRLSQKYLTIEEMMKILKNYCMYIVQYVSELRNNKSKGILYEIELYIKSHFCESLTIKEIAEHFYINSVYLGQIFAKTYGMGINEYLHKLRIEEAKHLLEQTDMKLNEIANKVGYLNYSRFVKKFEQYTRMKPFEYKMKFTKDIKNIIFTGDNTIIL